MEICYSFLFQPLNSLEKICSKSNLSVIIYRFKVKLVKSRFDDITYLHVDSIFYIDVVVITTAQLHSTKLECRFCAGSNPAHGVSEVRDDEDL